MYDRIGAHSPQKGQRIDLPMTSGRGFSSGTYGSETSSQLGSMRMGAIAEPEYTSTY